MDGVVTQLIGVKIKTTHHGICRQRGLLMSIENEQNKSGPVGRSLLPPGVACISINQMPAKAMNNC